MIKPVGSSGTGGVHTLSLAFSLQTLLSTQRKDWKISESLCGADLKKGKNKLCKKGKNSTGTFILHILSVGEGRGDLQGERKDNKLCQGTNEDPLELRKGNRQEKSLYSQMRGIIPGKGISKEKAKYPKMEAQSEQKRMNPTLIPLRLGWEAWNNK